MVWILEWANVSRMMAELASLQERAHGALNLEWLSYSTIAHGILYHHERLTHRDFSPLLTKDMILREAITWSPVSGNAVAFTCQAAIYPLDNAHARAFKRLCITLLANYPALISSQPDTQRLRVYLPTPQSQWELAQVTQGHRLITKTEAGVPCDLGPFRTLDDAERLARTRGRNVRFMAHPAVDHICQIWAGTARWSAKHPLFDTPTTTVRRQAALQSISTTKQ